MLSRPAVQAQPGSSGNLLRLADFDAACSKDIIDPRTDGMCRQAIATAAGKHPIVEEVRGADGRVTQTTKLAPADPGKTGWLGEEACTHGQWQSCMLYTMLLARGDGVPKDRQREEALMQYACGKGHSLACDSLKQRGVAASAGAQLPPRPTWVMRPAPERTAPVTVTAQTPARQSSDEMVARLQQWQAQEQQRQRESTSPNTPLNADDPIESGMIERCLAGTRGDCYSLARGYDQGEGLPRDAGRAAFYYDKACQAGHSAACDRLGKPRATPAPARAAAAPQPAAGGLSTTTLAGAGIGALVLVAVLVLSRRGGSTAEPRPRPRPVPVRPDSATRSSR
jgi:hypothetical protein